jgi:hypothetical protein
MKKYLAQWEENARLKMVAPYLIYGVNESKTNAIVLRANHRPMQMYN